MTVLELMERLSGFKSDTEVKVCVVDDNDACWSILGIHMENNKLYLDSGWSEEDLRQD